MHGPSSPSLPPRKPRNGPAPAPAPAPGPAVSLSPSKKHSPNPSSSTVRRRWTKIEKIENPKYLAQTLFKRRQGLFKKTEELHVLTGAHVALAIISPKGKFHSVCEPLITEMISTYLHRKDDVMLTEGLGEWLNRAEKECDSCKTKEDCDSWSMKYLAILYCLRKKSKDLADDPAVNAGAGDDSGVGVGVGAGNDFKILKGDEINSPEKNCETPHPAFVAFNEDSVDRNISLISPVNLPATGCESSRMESNSMCSDIEDIEPVFNCLTELTKDRIIQTVLWEEYARSDHEDFLHNEEMDLENDPLVNAGAGDDSGVGVGRDPEGLNDKEIDPLLFAFLKNLGNGVDCHNLSTPPVDSAAGGESSGMDFDEFCNNHLEDITILPEVDGCRTLS